MDSAWQAFEAEWRKSLAIYSLEYFHRTDHASVQGPYKHWTPGQRASRFKKLVDIINGHVRVGIGVAIPTWLYNEALTDRQKEACRHPYCVAALGCFIQVATWLRDTGQKAEIAYVIERGTRGKGHVQRIFDLIYEDDADRETYGLLSIRFEDKKRFVPLQAADILAFELHKHVPRMLGRDQRPIRTRDLGLLKRAPESRWGWADAPKLRQIADVLIKVLSSKKRR